MIQYTQNHQEGYKAREFSWSPASSSKNNSRKIWAISIVKRNEKEENPSQFLWTADPMRNASAFSGDGAQGQGEAARGSAQVLPARAAL